jgi:hypothetical protein
LREAGRFEAFMFDRKDAARVLRRKAANGGREENAAKADRSLVPIQSGRKKL